MEQGGLVDWRLVLQAVGVLAGVLSLTVALIKFANRRSAAFEQAKNSLDLIESLRVLSIDEEDVASLERIRVLRERLRERAFFGTQTYLSRTSLTAVTHWQTTMIFIGSCACLIVFFTSPASGFTKDVFEWLGVALFLAGVTVSIVVAMAVESNKATLRLLDNEIRPFVALEEQKGRLSLRQRFERVVTTAAQSDESNRTRHEPTSGRKVNDASTRGMN